MAHRESIRRTRHARPHQLAGLFAAFAVLLGSLLPGLHAAELSGFELHDWCGGCIGSHSHDGEDATDHGGGTHRHSDRSPGSPTHDPAGCEICKLILAGPLGAPPLAVAGGAGTVLDACVGRAAEPADVMLPAHPALAARPRGPPAGERAFA